MLKRGRKPSTTSMYFQEKEMNNLVKEYKRTKNEDLFKKIEPSFTNIINGMINKEFSYNYHIKNNRNDAQSECMCEILKSLNRYDPDKGRLFAYTNRIVKNTLLTMYKKNRRIKDKELTYTDLVQNVDSDMNVNDDELLSFSNIEANSDNSNTTDIDINNSNLINTKIINNTLNIDDSIAIIYTYIKEINDTLKYYLVEDNLSKLVTNIKYDDNVNFEFKSNKSILNITSMYRIILTNIETSIINILSWMEYKYKKLINNYVDNYDGIISNRAVGYIRNFVKSKLKDENLCRFYDINDIINFIQYCITKRYSEEV